MGSANDDFKWFGEGFDGFPRRLPESCMEYSIFVRASDRPASEVLAQLEAIRSTACSLTTRLLEGYIWQQDGFALEIVHHDDTPYLYGKTAFGDSIEDEWVVIYILREVSVQHEQAWIKVVDTDGELLLIEAADVLPRWLTPENSDNRVWINRGQVAIIPIAGQASGRLAANKASQSLSLGDALLLIDAGSARRDRRMDQEAFSRLRDYPGKIVANHHRALLRIPRKLACVLVDSPWLVSPAIDAFYLRDPISLRPLQAPDGSQLRFPPDDLVTLRVKFAKVGFAQLRSQRFQPPRAWARVLKAADAPSKDRIEMGVKLTSGFEMLVSDPQKKARPAVTRIKGIAEAVDRGERAPPSDSDIRALGEAADDESWLDINFEDLERELDGKPQGSGPGGFGDPSMQENLRRMASRLETMLNDESTGDGDDDGDDDDDDGPGSDGSSESGAASLGSDGEAKEGSFDEDEFTAMMREMMGMPRETMKELMGPAALGPRGPTESRDAHGSTDATPHAKEASLEEVSKRMEEELRKAGALRLDEEVRQERRGVIGSG